MARSQNKSYFHYAVVWRNAQSKRETSREYFLTAYDLCDYFSVSRKTIMDKVKDPSKVGRNDIFRGIEIIRVKEPVFIRVENPILSM